MRVVVRPGRDGRQLSAVVRWMRAFAPTVALLVAAPDARPPERDGDESIVIDADEVASGPLSLASALARALERRGGR